VSSPPRPRTNLSATLRHPRGAHYRRAEGPWQIPDLATVLRHAPISHWVDDTFDHGLTSIEVAGMGARLASSLRAEGVGKGDPVAWQLPNLVWSVALFRACWQIGAVAVPIHHKATTAERDERLAAVGADRCFDAPPDLVRRLTYSPMHGHHARPSDPAVVLFTAGSSGHPKGVIHTHRSLGAKTFQMIALHGLYPGQSVLMPAPLAHVSGLLNGVLVPAVGGMTSVLQQAWDPDVALTQIARHRVNFMVGPPTFFHALAEARTFSPLAVSSLALVSSGGAGVTPSFVHEMSERFGARFKRSYGSTEAPTVTTTPTQGDAWHDAYTDGRPHGDTELRIGTDGEVVVRGPEVSTGYLDPAQTAEAFGRGGWFHTGDLGIVDSDGWLTITGRKKDLIIRSGENISAAMVEGVLEAHPWVQQAAVIGEPDHRLGERVVAVIVGDTRFDLAECRRWFESQGAARFTTPERVELRRSLPLLAAGKVDKETLRRLVLPA